MRTPYALWSQALVRLSKSQQPKRRRRQSRREPFARQRRFEHLETREVLSATFASAFSIGGPAGERVFDMTADAAGNTYVTGCFAESADFDLSRAHAGGADILTARGETDAFIAKYAPDDSLVWVRRMGGDFVNPKAVTDVGRSVNVDAAGNVYVVGEFWSTADFGSNTLVSTGAADAFIAKFDASGNFRWVNRFSTTDSDRGAGVDVDASGNVYGLSVRTNKGHDLLKFSGTGTPVWSYSIASNSALLADLAVASDGSAFVTGEFSGTVDFDPGPKKQILSNGDRIGTFVLKVAAGGKFNWVTPFVGGYATGESIALDGSGNIVVSGSYQGTIDFNPARAVTSLDPMGGAYVAKLNNSGGLVWARALTNAGSGSSVNAYGLDVDTAGNVYVAGHFYGSIDLDPGAGHRVRTTAGGADIFVVKLSSAGNFVWGETLGGVGTDLIANVAVDGAGFVHLAGDFAGEVDFDPDPLTTHLLYATPGWGRDGFRVRLQQT